MTLDQDLWLMPDELMMMEFSPSANEFIVHGIGNTPAISFRRISGIHQIHVSEDSDPARYYLQIMDGAREIALAKYGRGTLKDFALQSECHAFEYSPLRRRTEAKQIIFYELLDRALLKNWYDWMVQKRG